MAKYTPEQVAEAKEWLKDATIWGWPKAKAALAALEAAEKDRDYEREQKQYYIGVGAELRSKLTEAQHEITRDIHDIAYINKSLDRVEKALAYAQTDNAKLKERVEGLQNGMKTLVDQRERLTTSAANLEVYISALEKAGDGMRPSCILREAADAWDAAREAKP